MIECLWCGVDTLWNGETLCEEPEKVETHTERLMGACEEWRHGEEVWTSLDTLWVVARSVWWHLAVGGHTGRQFWRLQWILRRRSKWKGQGWTHWTVGQCGWSVDKASGRFVDKTMVWMEE